MWLTHKTEHFWAVEKHQSFFALKLDSLDPKVAAEIDRVQAEYKALQGYLQAVNDHLSTRAAEDINDVEVPKCLQGKAPSASPRKKKATAARSSSKSQGKQKATESSSSTSQSKAE